VPEWRRSEPSRRARARRDLNSLPDPGTAERPGQKMAPLVQFGGVRRVGRSHAIQGFYPCAEPRSERVLQLALPSCLLGNDFSADCASRFLTIERAKGQSSQSGERKGQGDNHTLAPGSQGSPEPEMMSSSKLVFTTKPKTLVPGDSNRRWQHCTPLSVAQETKRALPRMCRPVEQQERAGEMPGNLSLDL
jgi:hypothetical protein